MYYETVEVKAIYVEPAGPYGVDSHENRSGHIAECPDNIFQGRQLADKTGKGQPGLAYSRLHCHRESQGTDSSLAIIIGRGDEETKVKVVMSLLASMSRRVRMKLGQHVKRSPHGAPLRSHKNTPHMLWTYY